LPNFGKGNVMKRARALYADSSLADLYDEVTMPPALMKMYEKMSE
jgi:hypothetical protein